MKQCPTCQKEFADSMRFCQTDGTPLVDKAPPPDPYKTIVGGSIKMDEDLLQIPPMDDPNKTMVSPVSAPKPEAPKSEAPKPISQPPSPSAPKFNEPGMKPPTLGASSEGSSSIASSGSSSTSDAAKSGSVSPSSPFNDSPKTDPPAAKKDPLPPPSFGASPFVNEGEKSSSPFDKPQSPPSSSPFDKPSGSPSSNPFEKTPPPPYKEPEPMFGGQPSSPFGQSPFDQPNTPFGQQNEPNQPFQQNEWTPPPAPVAGWQDQGLGSNTPFQPPVAGGQNQTLAIVSLVCGILSICLCGIVTGIPAVITGFMAKRNAETNPGEYTGRGMALAGLITGGIGTFLGLLGVIYWIYIISTGGRF